MIETALSLLGWWLLLALLASLVSAVFYPLLRFALAEAAPASRSLIRLLYFCMAPLAAGVALALGLLPGLGGVLVPDHCHGDSCAVHAPVYAVDSLALLGLSATGSLLALLMAVSMVWALRRARRRLSTLRSFGRDTPAGYRLLDSPQAIACCAGLWRPEVLLSRGLVRQLRAEELQIVLAHEHAHAQRLDNLRTLLMRWAIIAWPRLLARKARQDAGADAEQACDLAAVRAGFTRVQVAATIRRLAHLPRLQPSPGPSREGGRLPSSRLVAFNCDGTSGRLTNLEIDHERGSGFGWLAGTACLLLGWCVQVSLLSAVYHSAIEWLGNIAT